MRMKQRLHEHRNVAPSIDELQTKAAEGWQLAAVVWERETEVRDGEQRAVQELVPFGLRVAEDCMHLVEDKQEKEVIMLTLEFIVQDFRLSQVAEELNRKKYRTRGGALWNAASVFELLPRLIDIGPRIFSSQEWAGRRQRLFQAIQQ